MSHRAFVTAAVAPLVRTARNLDWPQRRAFLDDLRADAPTLVAEVERILASESASCPDDLTAPAPATGPAPAAGLSRWIQFLHVRADRPATRGLV